MNFWKKIRSLPLAKRKAILWVIIVILGVILMNWWLRDLFQRLENPELLRPEIPPIDLQEVFEDIPEFHLPPELLEGIEKAYSEKGLTAEEIESLLKDAEGDANSLKEQEELKENN